MRRVLNPNNRRWVIGALLIALALRALIPAGFMPATDRPFSFQICPDGYPAHLLKSAQGASDGDFHAAHHHHPSSDEGPVADAQLPPGHEQQHDRSHRHSSAGTEHCVFAAAACAGPLAWVPAFYAATVALETPEYFYASPAVQSLRFRVQQPRGPPALS
jgi:hypothetical protein